MFSHIESEKMKNLLNGDKIFNIDLNGNRIKYENFGTDF